MDSKNLVLIVCDEPIIYRPKPKRIHKIQNSMSNCNNGLFHNRHFNQGKNQRKNCHNSKNNKKSIKAFRNLPFNLDLISLEEIEKDFNEIKFKKEEIKVQKELLNLLRKASNYNHKKENICRTFGNFTKTENFVL